MRERLNIPTILIITDHPTLLYWAKKELDDSYFAIHASSRIEALRAAKGGFLSFILLDDQLEDADPLLLAAELSAYAPICLVTGRLSKSYRQSAAEAGVIEFLSDALDKIELQECIASIRDGKGAEKKMSQMIPKIPKSGVDKGLKHKVVMHDKILQLLKACKKVALVLIRIDDYRQMKKLYGAAPKEELYSFLRHQVGKGGEILPMPQGRFALLLSDGSEESAKRFAKAAQTKLALQKFAAGIKPFQLSVSIAYGMIPVADQSLNELLDIASSALAQSTRFQSLISISKELCGET